MAKMKINMIISSVIILFLFSACVNAFGVSTVNSVTIPLDAYPGQETSTDIRISNEEANNITVRARIISGADIANITNPQEAYTILPSDGDINKNRYRIQIKVVIPENATIGKQYSLQINVEQVNIVGDDMITMGYGITRIIPVNIINRPVSLDRQPVLQQPANITVDEMNPVNFTLSATDQDYFDNMTFFSTGLPGGATLNSTTGNFIWNTNYDSSGVYNITFTASDGVLNDSKNMTITVLNVQTNIYNSWIYGEYFQRNSTSDVLRLIGVDIDSSTVINNTNITNTTTPKVLQMNQSELQYSLLTDVTQIYNCTSLGTSNIYNTLTGTVCVNQYIDPTDVLDSNLTGTTRIINSTIHNSNVTYSGPITESVINTSNINGSTINKSNIQDSSVYDAVIIGSTINGSSVTNTTVMNTSVVNTSLSNMTIRNGVVANGEIYAGSEIVLQNGTILYVNQTTQITSYHNHNPLSNFSVPISAEINTQVQFNDESADQDVNGVLHDSLSYFWNFGDGENSSLQNPIHMFANAADYNVTLIVTDSYGMQSSTSKTLTITLLSQKISSKKKSDGDSGGAVKTFNVSLDIEKTNDAVNKTVNKTTDILPNDYNLTINKEDDVINSMISNSADMNQTLAKNENLLTGEVISEQKTKSLTDIKKGALVIAVITSLSIVVYMYLFKK